jgi:hypothetical protein
MDPYAMSMGLKHEKSYGLSKAVDAIQFENRTDADYVKVKICIEDMVAAAGNEVVPPPESTRSSACKSSS